MHSRSRDCTTCHLAALAQGFKRLSKQSPSAAIWSLNNFRSGKASVKRQGNVSLVPRRCQLEPNDTHSQHPRPLLLDPSTGSPKIVQLGMLFEGVNRARAFTLTRAMVSAGNPGPSSPGGRCAYPAYCACEFPCSDVGLPILMLQPSFDNSFARRTP